MLYYRFINNKLVNGSPRQLFPEVSFSAEVPKELFESMGGFVIEVPEGQQVVNVEWDGTKPVPTFEKIVTTIVDNIPPNPMGFLKYCFSGQDLELQRIFLQVRQAAAIDTITLSWYNDLTVGAIEGYFLIPPVPESGGWHLALVKLANLINLNATDRDLVNQALVKFALSPVL